MILDPIITIIRFPFGVIATVIVIVFWIIILPFEFILVLAILPFGAILFTRRQLKDTMIGRFPNSVNQMRLGVSQIWQWVRFY